MSTAPTFLFVGGGSLGHVLPSIAVARALQAKRSDSRIVFVCSDRPQEARRISDAGFSFHVLRSPASSMRGLSLLLFPYRFLSACMQARSMLRRESPCLVFLKGGSVSVPLGLLSRMLGISIVLHESDSVPSLSTRLLARFSKVICAGFPDIGLPPALQKKFVCTGNPVRTEIVGGSKAAGVRITGFSGKRPVLLVIGGSQGSLAINAAVESSLDALLDLADIIHLTGEGKMTTKNHARYYARESAGQDLPHLYALSDIVLTRAGAGALSELSVLRKPVIAIPLAGVGHDHQLKNAQFLAERNALLLLSEDHLSDLPIYVKRIISDAALGERLGESLLHAFPDHAAENVAEILLAHAFDSRIQS